VKHFADGGTIPDYIWNWVRLQNRIAYAIWFVTGLSIHGLILMAYRREAVTMFAFAVLAIYPLIYYVTVSDDPSVRKPSGNISASLAERSFCKHHHRSEERLRTGAEER
jgi:hypothetical protein